MSNSVKRKFLILPGKCIKLFLDKTKNFKLFKLPIPCGNLEIELLLRYNEIKPCSLFI